jgi:hypothetical protein
MGMLDDKELCRNTAISAISLLLRQNIGKDIVLALMNLSR